MVLGWYVPILAFFCLITAQIDHSPFVESPINDPNTFNVNAKKQVASAVAEGILPYIKRCNLLPFSSFV